MWSLVLGSDQGCPGPQAPTLEGGVPPASIKERRHSAALKRSSTHRNPGIASPLPLPGLPIHIRRRRWPGRLAVPVWCGTEPRHCARISTSGERGTQVVGSCRRDCHKGISKNRTTFPAGCITMRKSVVEQVCTGQQAFSGKGMAIFRDALYYLLAFLFFHGRSNVPGFFHWRQ